MFFKGDEVMHEINVKRRMCYSYLIVVVKEENRHMKLFEK